MEFYSKYWTEEKIKETNCNYGKLLCIDDKFYVNNIEFDNNRAIINDIVYINEGLIVGIKKREIVNIIGILYINSKIKYGAIKDKSLYLFKPSNKNYPNFYVPYKNSSNKNINIYTVINFNKWECINKLPIGTIIEVIGNVGNKEVEYEHLRYYYNIKNNSWKVSSEQMIKDMNIDMNINMNIDLNINMNIDMNINMKDQNYYEVFSIDPINSKDIDDAFHFKTIDKINNKYEIGLHIASPYTFFKNDILTVLNRVSTIYLPSRKYNMLPNQYADDIISLIENELRYALSIIINIDNNNIVNTEIKSTIVKNIKNYTYDNFNLIDFFQFSKSFFHCDESFDSHILVEKWMIFGNKYVAQYLIDKNITNLIVRKNENSDYKIDKTYENSELNQYLQIKKEHGALYEIYDKNKVQTHSKLNNEYYTHFTSPIRRAVDLFIHGLIIENKNIIEDNTELQKYVDNINTFTKNSRKFYRNVKRLEFLYNNKSIENNIITYGYIVNINLHRIRIYIPQYNLEESVVIIPYKFKNICVINNVKDYVNDHVNDHDHANDANDDTLDIIDYTLDNVNYIYKLYQRLELKLWIFTSFENIFDKLKIEII